PEIAAEVFESMLDPGRHEQRVARFEGDALGTAAEPAPALGHDIDFVLIVRRLGIGSGRRVIAKLHRAVGDQQRRAPAGFVFGLNGLGQGDAGRRFVCGCRHSSNTLVASDVVTVMMRATAAELNPMPFWVIGGEYTDTRFEEIAKGGAELR